MDLRPSTGADLPRVRQPRPHRRPRRRHPDRALPGQVFMACGRFDEVWSSCAFADAIQAALGARATVRRYDTGHLVGQVPAYPSSLTSLEQAGATIDYGGSPSATAEARGQAWPLLLRFLNTLPRR
ncbi:MAG: acyl-CoA thioester hydrolase/BAAT C-terminal domain-containing protein [Nocardioides sp.]